jgi:putative copper export protein
VSTFWQAVLYLHLLAMAFFVGGQLVFGIAVVPILRGEPGRERMRAVARRFGYGSLVALGVLLVTGWGLASHFDLWTSSTLQSRSPSSTCASARPTRCRARSC